MRYNFGIYHWRRHRAAIAAIIGVLATAGVIRRTTRSPAAQVMGQVLVFAGVISAFVVGRKLLSPAPWAIGQEKYDALATALPLEDANRVLDVGCGTGRSLVGLSEYVSESCSVTGVDVFTNDTILGNTPTTTRRNAIESNLNATVVIGDATALPFPDGSQDIVTVSRMFHDLSPENARRAIAESHRVCASEGRFGMIELPFPPGDGPPLDDPEAFWRAFVEDAGFIVETVESLPWKDGREYVIVSGAP